MTQEHSLRPYQPEGLVRPECKEKAAESVCFRNK